MLLYSFLVFCKNQLLTIFRIFFSHRQLHMSLTYSDLMFSNLMLIYIMHAAHTILTRKIRLPNRCYITIH
jgi:hypothetical protein